jgi:hypothetical protein
MSEYLQQQISTRRARLATLEKERVAIIAELSAYEDALANVVGDALHAPIIGRGKQQNRVLPVSKGWCAILERLVSFKHFNASDVKLVAQQLIADGKLSKPQTNDGVRAQLSLYAKKGIISRRGNGSYILTEATKAALQTRVRKARNESKTTWVGAAIPDPSDGG